MSLRLLKTLNSNSLFLQMVIIWYIYTSVHYLTFAAALTKARIVRAILFKATIVTTINDYKLLFLIINISINLESYIISIKL